MPRVIHFALAASVAALLTTLVEAQAPQTFRSNREVLTIETSVRDSDGRAVKDLQPSDFTVRVDGQARKVLTARLYGHDTPPALAAGPPAPAIAAVSNLEGPPGRAVVVAVDRDSIRPGGEKAVIDTAARLVETLGSADAAGAAGLPGANTDLSRDHQAVAAAVRAMTGTQPPRDVRHFLTWREAVAYERGDRITIQAAIARECNQEGQECPNELGTLARDLRIAGRAHAQMILQSLGSIIDRLGTISAPRHIILLSAGFPFDEELIVRYRDVADKAARAHVSLFIVQVEQGDMDASSRGPGSQIDADRDSATGLANVASITGGQFFAAAGRGGGVFDRIAADVNFFYQLGVESTPADADGKSHKVDVKVARTGVTVRAPAATATLPEVSRTPVAALKAALAEPVDVTELPLAVAAYVTHSADPAKVRVIVAPATPEGSAPPTLWGSVVMDGNKVVAAVGSEAEPGAAAPWSSTGTVEVPPGAYRLRTAIVGDNRVGTLDVPLVARLRPMGDAHASDLIIGTVTGGRLEPRSRLVATGTALEMVELSGVADLSLLSGEVTFVASGQDNPTLRAPMRFRARGTDGRVALGEVSVDLSPLPAGTYTATATIDYGLATAGRVSRRIDISAVK